MTPQADPGGGQPADPAVTLQQAHVQLSGLLREIGRTDLADRATAAAARLQRPATIVCVVGEFKQGKSTLVNGLLGREVCPVDDDLATSTITLVRYAEEPAAVVRRRVDGEDRAERIRPDELGEWVSESGNPRNEKQVEQVEVGVPAAVLKQGLVIADTPGMGGLGAGHAAATLGFLPFADGLVLVSDASAELGAPEIELLRQAVELCPTVLFVQSKIDLYPQWKKVFELNRGHLERQGLSIPMRAVSSSLRAEALARKDRSLNEASRFPALLKSLGDDVIAPARDRALDRSRSDLHALGDQVRAALLEEQRVVDDPAALEPVLAQLEEAKARLEHLKGPGARWSAVVGDRVADLSSQVTYEFRSALRSISQEADDRIETLSKGSEWDDVARDLQTRVSEAVTASFVTIERSRTDIRREVAELLEQENLGLPARGGSGAPEFDASSLWRAAPIDGSAGWRGALGASFSGLRGAQGGVMMFGMMGRFLPGAGALLLASNPVLLGAGAAFGSAQLIAHRRRTVAQRRQKARQQVRSFVDDVQFETTNVITGLVRQVQRELRDEFTALISELQTTYTEAARQAQAAAKRSQEERSARSREIAATLQRLRKIEQASSAGAAS